MAVGDIYQVVNEFEYQQNPNNYIWHLRVKEEGNPGDITQALLDFGHARVTAWLPLHTPSVLFRCNVVREVFPDTSVPEYQIYDPAAGGNRTCTPADTGLPGQCSCVVTMYGDIENPTQFNRGRDFITGQCCDDQFNGKWDQTGAPGAYLDDLCEMYRLMGNEYVNGLNKFDIGIYSRTRAKPPGDPPPPPIVPYFWVLQRIRAKQLVRTQRRRQPEDPCENFCQAEIVQTPSP